MSRATVVIRSNRDRERIAHWAANVPYGTRVEFKETKRSLPQSARMWACLTDIAMQKEHHGRKYTADQWKAIFMHAIGQDRVQFVPSLNGSTFLPLGFRSSDLSKDEMSELLEFIAAWGAENGVRFNDQTDVPLQAAE